MPVAEMLGRMSSAEVSEWIAYAQLEAADADERVREQERVQKLAQDRAQREREGGVIGL